ncbi:putative Fumarylacetoacetate hydrolase domain-containing protein 2 like protein [Fusarium oxysporum f. sp. albedinis]|nr:putative Fumarylacetoacetate hydrolase domain-containing protein 2 like protein [Fusarium oxysporum f. sp. albedinis]
MLYYLESATCKKKGRVEEENSPGGCEGATLSFEDDCIACCITPSREELENVTSSVLRATIFCSPSTKAVVVV